MSDRERRTYATTQHGTYARYFRDGCRCPMCVEKQRARVAANRAERLESGRLSHGTRSAYDAGCRCDDCRGARRSIYLRERKNQQRMGGAA